MEVFKINTEPSHATLHAPDVSEPGGQRAVHEPRLHRQPHILHAYVTRVTKAITCHTQSPKHVT